MKKKLLGNTHIEVSEICLGTMTWGQQNSESDAHSQLDLAIERGVNFLDTAEMYAVPPKAETYGLTEKFIGSWLKKRKNRPSIIIATKVSGRTSSASSGPPALDWIRNGPRLNRQQIFEALENSLRRLQTDYIDLYQIHWPERIVNNFGQLKYIHKPREDDVSIQETLEALAEAVNRGLIRTVGLSNETPWGVMQFLMLSEKLKLPRVVSIQNPYNLLNRSFENGLSEIAINEKVGLLAYSPLAGGVLTGKYLDNLKPKGARLTLWSNFNRYNGGQAVTATKEYVNLAKKFNITPAQLALSFVTSQPFVTSNIIGATNLQQLKENIDSIDVTLTNDMQEEIEKIHQRYPNPCP